MSDSTAQARPPGRARAVSWGTVARDASVIVLLALLCGALGNLLRPKARIDWVQKRPYDIVVPCPEPVGAAVAIAPGAPQLNDPRSFIVDARSAAEYAAWHVPRALNMPFDWLGPPVQEEVGRLAKQIAATNSLQIVIYGDGGDPDSGREWARLLSGGGIRNVSYVEGGAPALRGRVPPASTE